MKSYEQPIGDTLNAIDKFHREKGGTRRIGDLTEVCIHPEHLPATNQCLIDGIYEHECPACHHITRFTVDSPKC